MFRTFVTDGNVGLLNVTWTRTPSPLSYSQGRFRTQNKTSGTGQLTASLKVWDLKFYPDLGDYTVSVCNNCTCKNTTFFLRLFDCDPPTAVPQPVKEYQYHVWAESGLPSDLELYVFFNGSTDTFIYSMRWSHKGGDACSIQNNSCDRTFYESCAFTANLHIPNPSHKSSGLYTVQAIGSGEGRVASYNLCESMVTSYTYHVLPQLLNMHTCSHTSASCCVVCVCSFTCMCMWNVIVFMCINVVSVQQGGCGQLDSPKRAHIRILCFS